MNAGTNEWGAIVIFVVFLFAAIIGEVMWLVKKRWAAPGRATAYVITTDLLGLAIAGVIWLFLMVFMLMNVFGPSGTGATPGAELRIWLLLIFGILFTPVQFAAIKRAALAVFRIQGGGRAWLYSFAAALLLLAAIVAPSALFIYLA